MTGKWKIALAGLGLIFAASQVQAVTVIDTVGDNDGLGMGILDGGTVVPGIFDNRSAAEFAATDGSENTDWSDNSNGFGIDPDFVDFTHTYVLPVGFVITGVTLDLGFGGMQGNDNNPATKDVGADELFIDGVLVPDIFEPIEQDGDGFNVFNFALPGAVWGEFADGSAVVRIDTNFLNNNGDPMWFDFSRVVIEGRIDGGNNAVPEPLTAALGLMGLTTLGVAMRRRTA